ncbi:hypothetical protein HGM15179_022103, partial [Zosterops borbonicus]
RSVHGSSSPPETNRSPRSTEGAWCAALREAGNKGWRGMEELWPCSRVETAESRVSVLETMIDDLQWDIDKIRKREQRLNRHLADVLERVRAAL